MRTKYARDAARSTSTVLKYSLYSHGKIIEEIFANKGHEFDTISTFDEYIIKERWDLHWVDPSEMAKYKGASFLGRSPFDDDVMKALGKFFFPTPMFGKPDLCYHQC